MDTRETRAELDAVVREYFGHPTRDGLDRVARGAGRFVWNCAYRQLRDPHLADDVAQTVMLAIAKTRPCEVENGLAYLSRIAVHHAIKARRKRVRHQARDVEAGVHAWTSKSPPLAPEDARWIATAVDALPALERACTVLTYAEGLPAREVARVLETSERTVRRRLEEAHRRLQEKLGAARAAFVLESLPRSGISRREQCREGRRRAARHLRSGASRAPLLRAAALLLAVLATSACVVSLVRPPAWSGPRGTAGRPSRALTRTPPGPSSPRGSRPRALSALPRESGRRRTGEPRARPAARPAARGVHPGGAEGRGPPPAFGTCEIAVLDRGGAPAGEGILFLERASVEGLLDLREVPIGRGARLARGPVSVLHEAPLSEGNPVRFRYERVDGVLGAWITARARCPGYPDVVSERFRFVPGGSRRVVLVLPGGASLAVTVRDACDGIPLAGARVESIRAGDGVAAEARAAADGVAHLRGLAASDHTLRVRSEGYWPVRIAGVRPRGARTVWLHPLPTTHRGRLMATAYDLGGRRWRGARVVLRGDGTVPRRVAGDARGRCVFEDLPLGTYTVCLDAGVESTGGKPFAVEARVRLGMPGAAEEVVLGLPREDAALALQVRDAAGDALAGIRIRLDGPRAYAAETDAGGRAVVSPIASGVYRVAIARGQSAWRLREAVEAASGELREADFDWGAGTLRGRVIGRSPGGLLVRAFASDGRRIFARTRADGRFEIDGAPGGTCRVVAAAGAAGFVPVLESHVTVRGGEPSPEVVFDLTELGRLDLIVEADETVAGAMESLCRVEVVCRGGGGGEGRLAPAYDGSRERRFFGLLEPGSYELEVRSGDREPAMFAVDIAAGEDVLSRLRAFPAGGIATTNARRRSSR